MGQVMELAASCEIMKKLKLIGEPFKIYKNTAFIKGMFNSQVIEFKGSFMINMKLVGSYKIRRRNN